MSDTDRRARVLCADYADEGEAAFLIRTHDEDGIRLIGPALPAKTVAAMLRAAAEEYESRLGGETLN